VAVVGATHFMMEWIPPDEPNGEIIGYHFSYQSSKPAFYQFVCLGMLTELHYTSCLLWLLSL